MGAWTSGELMTTWLIFLGSGFACLQFPVWFGRNVGRYLDHPAIGVEEAQAVSAARAGQLAGLADQPHAAGAQARGQSSTACRVAGAERDDVGPRASRGPDPQDERLR